MARAFILGHGARIPGVGRTFVPEGKSISFYSDVDEATLRTNGLAALNAGDIPPVEKFDAKSGVDNYELSRFEDGAIAEHMASESSLTGGKTYFIGLETRWQTTPLPSPLSLCTTPDARARTRPKHSPACKGLFALVPEDELLSVSCRSVLGQNSPPVTTRLGARKVDDKGHDASEDFFAETQVEAGRLIKLSKTDPAAVIAYVESLSEPTRQMLFQSWLDLKTFVEEYYAGTGGGKPLPPPPPPLTGAGKPEPTLPPPPTFEKGGAASPEAVLEARRALEALGEDSFADHVDTYGAKQKQMVLADAGLKAAYDRSVEKRTKEASRSEEERDREAIERQKTRREKAQPQIDALKRRMAGAASGAGAVAGEVVPTTLPPPPPPLTSGGKPPPPLTGGDMPLPPPPPRLTGAPAVNAVAGKQEVDRTVKLLELLLRKETDDPHRAVAIALMTKRLTDSDQADAPSISGSKT